MKSVSITFQVVFLKLFSKCTSGQLSMCLSFLGNVSFVTIEQLIEEFSLFYSTKRLFAIDWLDSV